MMLNNVCTIEIAYNTEFDEAPATRGLSKPIAMIIFETTFKNGWNRIRHHRTPNTLNTECPIAALLAETFATEAAMLAVIVVPMFSPRTIAAPISNGIQPLLHITRVRAMVALED